MRYLSVFILFLFITSCDSSRVYEDYYDLEEAFWHLDSVHTFPFQIEDTTRAYNLKATFRNASSYPFYNLYFQYTLKDSSGNVLQQQLKEIYLIIRLCLRKIINFKVQESTHFLLSSTCVETPFLLSFQLERESNSLSDLGPSFILLFVSTIIR